MSSQTVGEASFMLFILNPTSQAFSSSSKSSTKPQYIKGEMTPPGRVPCSTGKAAE